MRLIEVFSEHCFRPCGKLEWGFVCCGYDYSSLASAVGILASSWSVKITRDNEIVFLGTAAEARAFIKQFIFY